MRHYGDGKVAGIVFTNASTRLGVPGRENDIGEEYKALGPALCSTDLNEGVEGLMKFVNLCVKTPHNQRDFFMFLGMTVSPSAYARSGILLRKVSNDDVLKSIKVPMLMIHGMDDKIILTSVTERHATLVAHEQVLYYENTGHCSYWEQAETYNRDLVEFCDKLC